MRKLAALFGFILFLTILFGCEVENCPPNSMTYAHFSLVDQHGRAFKSSDTISIIGQIETDVVVYETLPDGTQQSHTVYDSLVNDTFINREVGANSFKLPLSYANQTRFIFVYRGLNESFRGEDTIDIYHNNIPYFTNLDCGTMMFYTITQTQTTHHRLDSLVVTNSNIDNYDKENFKIYYTVTTSNE